MSEINGEPMTFETILRQVVDQHGCQPGIQLACMREKIENEMLEIINEHNLLEILLVRLKLCKLCQNMQIARKGCR